MIKYKINGKEVTKEEWDAKKGVGFRPGHAPLCTVAYSDSKPLISDALGCMKAQVPDMRAMIKEEKIRGVKVLNNGQVAITSRSGRKKLIETLSKIRGVPMVDADAGYSD